MKQPDSLKTPTRRAVLRSGIGAAALLAHPVAALAAAPPGFDQWRDGFRARALAKGISDATYTRVMGHIEPDMSVFKQMRNQPEFNEQIWQYINRRVSDWRIIAGKEALRRTRRCLRGSRRISASSAARCWRSGASNPPMAIRWCSRTICARYFHRSQHSPGTSRGAAPIGKPN